MSLYSSTEMCLQAEIINLDTLICFSLLMKTCLFLYSHLEVAGEITHND